MVYRDTYVWCAFGGGFDALYYWKDPDPEAVKIGLEVTILKRFIQTFFMCFVFMAMFFFFGGFHLFYFSQHPYRTAASIAFLMAVLICVWISQEERVDELERRIRELEGAHSEQSSDQ